MVKYFLHAGIGVLFFSMPFRQPSVNDTVEINSYTYNDNYFSPLEGDKPRFDLPEEGPVVAHADENRLYSGTVKKRKLHGRWESWYTNQQMCDSGSFFKGLPVGEWKHWNANGQLIAIRHYDATKLLLIKNEFIHAGPKQVVFPLTKIYRKNRAKAERYMQAGYSFSFTDHHPHHFSLQQAVEKNTSGNDYRPLFDECLHHGLYMNFFNDGMVKDSGYYKNGLKDGVWVHRDANGVSQMGMYRNGVKQGDWKQYNKNGRIQAVIFYNKQGIETWRKRLNT